MVHVGVGEFGGKRLPEEHEREVQHDRLDDLHSDVEDCVVSKRLSGPTSVVAFLEIL